MEKCDIEVGRLQGLLVQEQRQLADALRDYSALKGDLRALEVQLRATSVQYVTLAQIIQHNSVSQQPEPFFSFQVGAAACPECRARSQGAGGSGRER